VVGAAEGAKDAMVVVGVGGEEGGWWKIEGIGVVVVGKLLFVSFVMEGWSFYWVS